MAKNLSKEEIYEEALKYTVLIRGNKAKESEDYIAPVTSRSEEISEDSMATGIVIKDESEIPLVVTKNHVVRNKNMGEIYYVWFYGHSSYERVKKIGYDEKYDWAILEFINRDFKPPGFAKLGSNTNTHVGGGTFFILGNPRGAENTFIEAKLANKRAKHFEKDYVPMSFDARCAMGFSGGPVIDGNGEVVGLVEFILESRFSPCFVAPIEIFKKLYMKLMTGGEIKHGTLGLQIINAHEFTPGELKWLHTKKTIGVVIKSVIRGSHANKVGLVPGDTIRGIKLDNEGWVHVQDVAEFRENLHLNFFPGDNVELMIERNDKIIMIRTLMESGPEPNIKIIPPQDN